MKSGSTRVSTDAGGQRSNSKEQWFITAFLVGGFMLLLMITQNNTLQSQQPTSNASRQASIATSDGKSAGATNAILLANDAIILLDEKRADKPLTTAEAGSAITTKRTVDTKEGSKGDDQRIVKKNKPIKQITILGERNSGTRWTFDHMSECFNHTLTVRKRLTRYKHWFQHNDPTLYPHDTLVLAQFRNPYEWLLAMQHVPHHSPAHLRTALTTTDPNSKDKSSSAENDWEVFLTKTWTTERVGLDLQMKGDEICQDNFRYKDVVSCALEPLPKSYYNWTIRYSEHQPFYEMKNDGSGEPYDNIMEMRSDKIRNFLDVINYDGVADVKLLQYEYLVRTGTQQLLNRIEEMTGVKALCKAKEPQNRPSRSSRIITPEFAQFIRLNLNWTVEGMIGYKPEFNLEQS